MDVTLMMTEYQHFAECMGPRENGDDLIAVRQQWGQTDPGKCANQANQDYDSRRLALAARASSASSAATGPLVDGAAPKRNLFAPAGGINRLKCSNSYLPWASVRVHNISGLSPSDLRCAYEFGAPEPSINGDWENVLAMTDKLRMQSSAPQGTRCWVLVSDDCVVSFHDEKLLTMQEQGENQMIKNSGIICGVLAVFSALITCFWHVRDMYFGNGSVSYQGLPTSEPVTVEVLLSDRVRQIMNVAASRLTDETPPATGENTFRGSQVDQNRTILMAPGPGARPSAKSNVPKNVAADFVTRAPGGWQAGR